MGWVRLGGRARSHAEVSYITHMTPHQKHVNNILKLKYIFLFMILKKFSLASNSYNIVVERKDEVGNRTTLNQKVLI